MRELDLLLSAFLDESYDSLSEADQQSFENLLTCTDDQLLRWLTGRAPADDAALSGIISLIKASRTGS